MQILSDWQTGKPPMPGVWLTRADASDGVPTFMEWDGTRWHWMSGAPSVGARWQWCGLAFDPSKAKETECAETGVMGWFIPGNGPSRQPWLDRITRPAKPAKGEK